MTAAQATRRVGLIGLGRMGMAICARLIDGGHRLTVFDSRTELRAPAAALGAEWATCAAKAVDGVNVVLTVLPGALQVTGVIAEVIDHMPASSTWIDMSTASPETARARAAAAAPRGIGLLDAPVGGGPELARDGRLIAFVGGAAADLAAHRAILATVADRVVHVGAAGAGYTVKLLVNLLWFGQALLSAEALGLAQRAGVAPEALREAVAQSAAANAFMANDAEALLTGDDLAAYSLAAICQQLATVQGLGAELAVPLELAALISDLHHRALAHYGDVDGELLGARLIAERAGLIVDRSARSPSGPDGRHGSPPARDRW